MPDNDIEPARVMWKNETDKGISGDSDGWLHGLTQGCEEQRDDLKYSFGI